VGRLGSGKRRWNVRPESLDMRVTLSLMSLDCYFSSSRKSFFSACRTRLMSDHRSWGEGPGVEQLGRC
jgi:hypothetical protein